jgi:hypothetical protein
MSEKKEVDLKKIAKELEIDRPIMSFRVVGSRVEVYPLGGEMMVWPDSPAGEAIPTPSPSLKGGEKADKERPAKKEPKAKGKKK